MSDDVFSLPGKPPSNEASPQFVNLSPSWADISKDVKKFVPLVNVLTGIIHFSGKSIDQNFRVYVGTKPQVIVSYFQLAWNERVARSSKSKFYEQFFKNSLYRTAQRHNVEIQRAIFSTIGVICVT